MAIYHFSLKTIGRAAGRSAVGSAAYISGTRLRCEETGLIYNYRRKKEVVFRHIFLPDNAPTVYQDREMLWNAVQKIEKRSDARFARLLDIALPKEFDRDLQIQIVCKYVKDQFAARGMCADVAIHDKGDGNPHAHIMLTTRQFNPDGTWSKKEKSVLKLDESGNKIPIIDPETGKQKVRIRKGKGTEKLWQRVSVPSNDWNKRENIELWRKAWADICNQHLEPSHQVDHRSYVRRGIDQEPTIHEGYMARKMERKGENSDRCDHNRQVRERNRLRQEIRSKAKEIYEYILGKARRIYGRITGYFGDAEPGRSDDGPFGRRRQIAHTAAEGKRCLELADHTIDRAKQASGETDYFLKRTEQEIAGTEPKIAELQKRIALSRKENELRFHQLLMEHERLMARRKGTGYGTGENVPENNRRIPAEDSGTGRYHQEPGDHSRWAGRSDQGVTGTDPDISENHKRGTEKTSSDNFQKRDPVKKTGPSVPRL